MNVAVEPPDIDEWLETFVSGPPSDDEVGRPILSFLNDVAADETKGLRFRSAREIAQDTPDEVQFVAAYLASGAITELDGKPKAAGKTTFVLAMIRAIVDGSTFLAEPTVKGSVVMLTEQPLASIKPALMRAGLADSEDLLLLVWADAAGTQWVDIVTAAAAEARRIGAHVLVVDTLPQFAGLRGDSENNSGDALEAIEPLQRLLGEGFAILVTRHDRKSGGEVGDSARGSGAFTGAVDIVIAMSRSPDGRPTTRRLACLSRFSETPADLVIELVDGRYVVVGTTPEAVIAADKERLVEVLAALEQSARAEYVAESLGKPEPAVRKLLNDLLAEGRVDRHGAGRKGDPYLWTAAQDGPGVPFVSLRETSERKLSVPDLGGPGPDRIEMDYPPSAWSDDDDLAPHRLA